MFELVDNEKTEASFTYLGVYCEVIRSVIGIRHCAVLLPDMSSIEECFSQVVQTLLKEEPEVKPQIVSVYRPEDNSNIPRFVLSCTKNSKKIPAPDLEVLLEQSPTPDVVAQLKQVLVNAEITEDRGEVVTCEEMANVAGLIATCLFELNPNNKEQITCIC